MADIIQLSSFKNRLFTPQEKAFFENLFHKGKAHGAYSSWHETCKDGEHKLSISSVALERSPWGGRIHEKAHFSKKRHSDGCLYYEYHDGKMEADVATDTAYNRPIIVSNKFHIMIPTIIEAQRVFVAHLLERLEKCKQKRQQPEPSEPAFNPQNIHESSQVDWDAYQRHQQNIPAQYTTGHIPAAPLNPLQKKQQSALERALAAAETPQEGDQAATVSTQSLLDLVFACDTFIHQAEQLLPHTPEAAHILSRHKAPLDEARATIERYTMECIDHDHPQQLSQPLLLAQLRLYELQCAVLRKILSIDMLKNCLPEELIPQAQILREQGAINLAEVCG